MTKARGERQKGEKRERERVKREEGDRCSQLCASVQGHTREKGAKLSITFRNTPTSERGREGVGEEGGLSSRQVPMSLEQALVAATTYGLPEGCHL